MNWASGTLLCVLVGGFVSVPHLRLQATARAEDATTAEVAGEDKPQAAQGTPPPAAAPDEPFTATFSNGVKVQLIGLSENPSKGKPWWAPDGTRLEAAPYARVPAIMHPDENQLAREICFRWQNLPEDPDFQSYWGVVPPGGGMGGGNAFDATNKRLEDLTAWAVIIPSSGDTCTVKFFASVRATPWLTIFTNNSGNMSSMGGMIDGVRQGAIFGAPQAQDGGTSITVSYQIPDRAVRLLAVANDGLPDVGASKGGAGVLDFSQVTYHFANLAPNNVQRFELQSQKRFFESVKFRNVSLHPDQRTSVEIVRPPIEKPDKGSGA
jgi:hypothetical protein